MRASPDQELRCRLATASASAVPGPAASKRMVMLKRARRTVHAAVQAARIAATGTISWQAKSARATERGRGSCPGRPDGGAPSTGAQSREDGEGEAASGRGA